MDEIGTGGIWLGNHFSSAIRKLTSWMISLEIFFNQNMIDF